MMIITGLHRLGNAKLEEQEVMDLEERSSQAVYAFVKQQPVPPKNYSEYPPLIRGWIDTQKTAYSLTVPEKQNMMGDSKGALLSPTSRDQQRKLDQAQSASGTESRSMVDKRLRAAGQRIDKRFTEKLDRMAVQLGAAGGRTSTGGGPAWSKTGWRPGADASFRSHRVCANCGGRRNPPTDENCPSKKEDHSGRSERPNNPRDRCGYEDPSDHVICRGSGHTTRQHVKVAMPSGVNRSGKGKGKRRFKGKGKFKGRKGFKGKGKGKGGKGKGKKGGKERFFLQSDSGTSSSSSAKTQEIEEQEQFEGLYDENDQWHEVYEGKSYTQGADETWNEDPPELIEKHWDDIYNECDEGRDDEREEGDYEDAWEDGSYDASQHGGWHGIEESWETEEAPESDLASRFYGETRGGSATEYNACVRMRDQGDLGEFAGADHGIDLLTGYYAEEGVGEEICRLANKAKGEVCKIGLRLAPKLMCLALVLVVLLSVQWAESHMTQPGMLSFSRAVGRTLVNLHSGRVTNFERQLVAHLSEGCNIKAFVYVGGVRIGCTWDTGAHR